MRRSLAMSRVPGGARGQVMVPLVLILALLIVPLAGAVLAMEAQRTTEADLQRVARDAALDAVGALDPSSLAAGAPRLDPRAAETLARRALTRGFSAHAAQVAPPTWVSAGHLATANADSAVAIAVLNATQGAPLADPDGGGLYHHPTVCISAAVRVGVVLREGLTVTHHLHACAQDVVP